MNSQQGHLFIDPDNCGSSVGYYLDIAEYKPKDRPVEYGLSATVVLADCSHKIDWSFGVGDTEKIDNAIRVLTEFRKKFNDMEKLVQRKNDR